MTIDPNLLLNILVASLPLIGLGIKLWHSVEMIEYKLLGLQSQLDRANTESVRRDRRTDEALRQITMWATHSSSKPFAPRSPQYPSEDPPTGWDDRA